MNEILHITIVFETVNPRKTALFTTILDPTFQANTGWPLKY